MKYVARINAMLRKGRKEEEEEEEKRERSGT